MFVTRAIEKAFQKYLPSPFAIAVILTLLTMALALLLTPNTEGNHFVSVLSYWETGIWNNDLLVFAYQMMLILVLGHILMLSRPVSRLADMLAGRASSTRSAVVLVSAATMLVSFFNWGLGLIFGAVMARKVAEVLLQRGFPIHYPLVGAAAYAGFMVWHAGISGSAPLKVAESGHLTGLMQGSGQVSASGLPDLIPTAQTVFSWWNLLLFGILLMAVPLCLYLIAKRTTPVAVRLSEQRGSPSAATTGDKKEGAESTQWADSSRILTSLFGGLLLAAFLVQYGQQALQGVVTPNMLNFFMLGLGILLHGTFRSYLAALRQAVKGAAGILLQFPLYFGIMGIMKDSGLAALISEAFVSLSNEATLPVFTFFSAGLVNIFVPSGGGQWAIQGPIVVEAAQQLGVSLPKMVMALAYGDQLTNMVQPFWALPLLAITGLKAREILPYTLVLMLVGGVIYLGGLLLI